MLWSMDAGFPAHWCILLIRVVCMCTCLWCMCTVCWSMDAGFSAHWCILLIQCVCVCVYLYSACVQCVGAWTQVFPLFGLTSKIHTQTHTGTGYTSSPPNLKTRNTHRVSHHICMFTNIHTHTHIQILPPPAHRPSSPPRLTLQTRTKSHARNMHRAPHHMCFNINIHTHTHTDTASTSSRPSSPPKPTRQTRTKSQTRNTHTDSPQATQRRPKKPRRRWLYTATCAARWGRSVIYRRTFFTGSYLIVYLTTTRSGRCLVTLYMDTRKSTPSRGTPARL